METKLNKKMSDKLLRGPYNENYEELYGFLDYKDKVVLDVGADYGSTPLFFLSKGAKKVIAVEMNEEYAKTLIQISKTEKRIIPVIFKINSGYNISNLIKKYSPDIVKMDCDGCEVFIIQMIDEDIRMVKEWIMEIHAINPCLAIKDLFLRNGFEIKYYKIDPISQWAWIVWFVRKNGENK